MQERVETSKVKPSNSQSFQLKVNEESNDDTLLIKNAIFIRHAGSLVKVKYSDILWLKADGNYTTLFARKAVYSVRNILKNLEDILPAHEFMRIHKSYIVRIDEIESINSKDLKVAGDLIPVGRTYYHVLIDGIQKLGMAGD